MPYSKNNSINWSEVFYETPNWDPQIIEPLRNLQTEISTEKLIDPKKIGAPFEYKTSVRMEIIISIHTRYKKEGSHELSKIKSLKHIGKRIKFCYQKMKFKLQMNM